MFTLIARVPLFVVGVLVIAAVCVQAALASVLAAPVVFLALARAAR